LQREDTVFHLDYDEPMTHTPTHNWCMRDVPFSDTPLVLVTILILLHPKWSMYIRVRSSPGYSAMASGRPTWHVLVCLLKSILLARMFLVEGMEQIRQYTYALLSCEFWFPTSKIYVLAHIFLQLCGWWNRGLRLGMHPSCTIIVTCFIHAIQSIVYITHCQATHCKNVVCIL
jgi:hypothetical protein